MCLVAAIIILIIVVTIVVHEQRWELLPVLAHR